jgi:hypothetical protein
VNHPQRLPVLDRRRSAVLLHPSSLLTAHGDGALGSAAFAFIDWLAEAGFTVWQVLPLGLPALLQPLVLQLGQPLFWQLLVAWRLLMRPRAPESLDRFPEPRGME